jgi:DNA-binding transcriptional ArsR family regulator
MDNVGAGKSKVDSPTRQVIYLGPQPTEMRPMSPQSLARSRDLDIETMIANARDAAEFLKALSHEARLVILCLLAQGEKSVTEIEQMLKLRQPAVSQQLARLRADGLVEARKAGKSVYYSLAKPEVRDVIMALHGAFCVPRRAR